jgi:carboxyl-terminal processing protease
MKKIYSHRRLIKLVGIIGVFAISTGFVSNYFDISKNLEIFTNLYRELNIYYVDETQPGNLMKTGIDAMLKSLDPYTVYYPESKIEDYRFMTTGQYGGIGALIHTHEGDVTISQPYEGYPAQKNGLRAGDVVIAIDGESIKGKKQSDISDVLKGQPGTEVTLTVERYAVDEPMDFTVEREEVKIPDVPYYGMLDDKTGYIKLNGFTKTASMEVRTAFKDLKGAQGMEQLVFDLRGNGGGLLREAVNIVNMFVPKGQEIVSTKGKLEEWNKTHVALNEPEDSDIPVVVLVDGGSASASEIVSGALQDLDRAVVIGSRSFGKGLVQQTKDLAYNSKLKLTVAKYYIPSGRCIQKLDYSHRSTNGKVDEVPDSLIKPFTTQGGRTVFDGRGIEPDVKVEFDPVSNVLNGMVSNHIIFDFATKYRTENDSIPNAKEYGLTEKEFSEFISYAQSQEFEYNTGTEQQYKDLVEAAKKERYYDHAAAEFEELFAKIEPRKDQDILNFEDQIKDFLEHEIVGRYYYQTGGIQYGLENDPYIDKAIEVFSDNYTEILANTEE